MTKGGVRDGDPVSSVEAADSVDAPKLENIFYATLKKHSGWLTYFQIATISGVDLFSITPRGKPLWVKGWVKREMRPGANSHGKIRNLLHFKAVSKK